MLRHVYRIKKKKRELKFHFILTVAFVIVLMTEFHAVVISSV